MSRLQRGVRSLRQLQAVKETILSPSSLGELPGLNTVKRCFVSVSQHPQAPVHIEDEPFCRQRNQIVLGNRVPETSPCTWIAPNAVIVGDVDLFDKVSIWYGCVLRGDLNNIKVGAFSNIQDKTVIHAARTSPTGLSAATSIGRFVTVGQACVLRSTTVEHECIIGDKSILMEGSLVESHSILAPGTVVAPGRLIPGGQLWAGNPARYVRDLTKDEKAAIPNIAESVFELMDRNKSEQQLPSFQYVDAERIRNALQEGEKAAATQPGSQ